jgi:hypothetical protein
MPHQFAQSFGRAAKGIERVQEADSRRHCHRHSWCEYGFAGLARLVIDFNGYEIAILLRTLSLASLDATPYGMLPELSLFLAVFDVVGV